MITDRIIELQKLQAKIEEKRNEIERFELNPDDFERHYDLCLDECEGTFMGYSASNILREVDPIAYRCGLLDYVDNLDNTESQEFLGLEEELEELEQDFIDFKSDCLTEIEEELEELEEESRLNTALIEELSCEYNFIENNF